MQQSIKNNSYLQQTAKNFWLQHLLQKHEDIFEKDEAYVSEMEHLQDNEMCASSKDLFDERATFN